MKKVLLILAVASLSLSTFCSDGNNETRNIEEAKFMTTSVSGKVIDKSTGESLAGVAIRLDNSDREFYTDFEGAFHITDLVPGSHEIKASLISYKEGNVSISTQEKTIAVYIEPISE